MGIKGIYGEIGPGERVALSKLAIEKFEQTGRPLRIAIDISIWQFQIQAGQGGSNPAIRTFYYRLLRLMSVSVQPLFVFDGPHKPPFKRNKRSSHNGASVPNLLCKQLLNHFGFPFHMAPGEAEAECALLQREGIVDAVLSEDVDTLMFGSGLTLRNWSSEGRGNKSPTHVSAYYSEATRTGKSGLDREGMILIALMSGGDYVTEGIPGCGVKAACEAARAGFGKSLCQLSRSDVAGLKTWRNNLTHEIQTNDSKFFRIKHKSLKIPEDFPNKEVLGYYTHPVVSSASKLQRLKDEIVWDGDVDILALRLFVAEAFNWTHKTGATKFIRGIAPALLCHKLRLRADRRASGYDDVVLTAMHEMELVRAICGKRTHFSTDGVPELRVIYHPVDIVGLDLDAEEDDNDDYGRDGLAPGNEDHEIEAYESDPDPEPSSANPSKRTPSIYDPTQPEKLWIFEAIAKVGIPLKVEDYEEAQRDPKKFLRAKAAAKRAATKGGMPKGAMDKFVSISKHGMETSRGTDKRPNRTKADPRHPILPLACLAPTLGKSSNLPSTTKSSVSTRSTRPKNPTTALPSSNVNAVNAKNTKIRTATKPIEPQPAQKTIVDRPGTGTNPWTIALSSSPQQAHSITKNFDRQSEKESQDTHIDNSSSSSLPGDSIVRKHGHSPQLEGEGDENEGNGTLELNGLAAPRTRNHSSSEEQSGRPSPRKKRSPQSPSATNSPALPPHPRVRDFTPEQAVRKIDFLSSPTRARSASPALPPQRELLQPCSPPEKTLRAEPEHITLSSSPEFLRSQIKAGISRPVVAAKGVDRKRYIMLRDSLPGAWKEVDESQLVQGKSRAWRYSQVECLDLSVE